MKQITQHLINLALDRGFSMQDASRGYGIFSSPAVAEGALHIERIDCMGVFNSDHEAGRQAEKDGILIIHDKRLKGNLTMYPFLDTPENRAIFHRMGVL